MWESKALYSTVLLLFPWCHLFLVQFKSGSAPCYLFHFLFITGRNNRSLEPVTKTCNDCNALHLLVTVSNKCLQHVHNMYLCTPFCNMSSLLAYFKLTTGLRVFDMQERQELADAFEDLYGGDETFDADYISPEVAYVCRFIYL